jgi:hypothetical protein
MGLTAAVRTAGNLNITDDPETDADPGTMGIP